MHTPVEKMDCTITPTWSNRSHRADGDCAMCRWKFDEQQAKGCTGAHDETWWSSTPHCPARAVPLGCLPGDPSTLFTLAATLPAIQAHHPRFPPHLSLTPPFNNDDLDSDRPWSIHSGQRGSDGPFPMSRPPPRPSNSAQTTSRLSPIFSHFGMQPPRRGSPRHGPMNHPVLPPLRQLSSTPPTPSDRRHDNPFQSILNPQADLVEQQRGRRRSASRMETPSPVDSHNPHRLPSVSRPPSVDSTQEDQHPSRPLQPPARPPLGRHILSPKSPRLHRTQSLNVLNHVLGQPTGTIDAHASPFLTASTRPSESVLSHPSLPTPPAGGRPSYFPPVSTTSSGPPVNLAREGRRPSIGFPQSGSASPIGQCSPYSQTGSVASSQFDTPSTPGYYGMRQPSVQMHESRHSAGPMEGDRNMIPMAPSGQSSIQLMTIKSQQGHNVQIPVDVQAASKVADEKRRRNAGASARFRARRKEKEREASMSISRLEQQLRNALEDAEFYRSERDYFKAICQQEDRGERPHVRPTSPRLRRPSIAPSHAPSSTRAGSEDSYAEYEEGIREEERNVRRRTSNHYPAPDRAPNDLGGPSPQGGYSPGYTIDAPTSQAAPQSQRFLHREESHRFSQHGQHAPDRPVYHDPFTADNRRYDNRN
ncbi:hypothetical protein BDU57DRAFT_558946 [Ampelomyces quisqualis]|uniref:BZIP domain-containing protein n=1 Tax=Ampelomyces quisqualis TaxID=50730 RepID=A0A6A5QEG5_AMPQU|nr:hypothetical protein BDU57DRAFT_558946 [Ampelomyces quisqualis]